MNLRFLSASSLLFPVLLGIGLMTFSARAQTAGDYRSVGSDTWSTVAVWQKYDGAAWNAATAVPTSADGVITISAGTMVTNTASRSVDQVVVAAGGLLVVSSSTLTIAHSTGPDLDVSGTVYLQGSTSSFTLAANAVVNVEAGGVIVHNGTSNGGVTAGAGSVITFLSGGKFQLLKSGGTIFTATWSPGSICEIAYLAAGASKPTVLGQTFQNFTWNYLAQAASVDLAGGLTTAMGTFTVLAGPTNAATELKLSGGMTIGGDLVVDNGSLNLDGSTATLNWSLAGNLLVAPGAQLNLSAGSGGVYTLVFNGTTPQTYQCLGTNIATKLNWTVNAGATLNLSNNAPISTAGRALTANGTVNVNGNIVYADVITGTGSIRNQSGGNGLLDLGVGGANNTLDGTLALSDGAAGTLGLVKSGAGTLTITANTAIGGGLVVSNGTVLVNNLTGSGTGGGAVTVLGGTLGGTGSVGGAVTVQGTGSLGAGTGTIGTLTINNNLTLGASCKVQVNTAGAQTTDKFTGINTLTYGGALTINNAGAALTASDSFKIFNAAHYSGSFASITPTIPATGLTWDMSTLATDGTLRIASGVNLTPTNIVVSVTGNNVNLSWPADHIGWQLQAQTNTTAVGLSANWVTVPGLDTTNQVTLPVDPTQGSVFYRLTHP